MFENHRRGRQARNFTTNVPKILDLKSSSEQIFFRKLSLGAPVNRYALYPNTHSDVISKEGEAFPRSDSLKSSNVSTFDTKVQTISFVSLALAVYSYVSFNEPIVLFASIKKYIFDPSTSQNF